MANPEKQVNTGRTQKGTFQKGVSGNPNGRPKKYTISDYITEEEVHQLVEIAKEKAHKGDTNMLKLLFEQVFGKAPQAMDVTTQGDKIIFSISKEIANRNEIKTGEEN